jgi:hypothetical protein
MLLKLSSTPMDPRLRFFTSNNWSWELNITTTNLTVYSHQTGTPHDAILAKTLMHHHNQSIFQQFCIIIQKSYSLVKVFYIYSFFLLKATEFWSQFCIKCFSKSSCMMLCPFHLRLMNFMLSYRIRSCISVAAPQVSAQMGQTVTTICF